MFLETFLRLFADCALLFGLLGSVPSLLPYSYPLPVAALICALSGMLSLFLQEKGKAFLGRCCSALPLLTLLLAKSPMEMLVLIVPLLYTAFICFRGELHQEYFGYRQMFTKSFIVLLALWVVLSFVMYFEDPLDTVEDVIQTGIIIRYAILYFLCGVVLQRQLRLGAQNSGKSEWGQLGGILAGLGVVLTGFALTAPLLQADLQKVLLVVAIILLLPFTLLFEFAEFLYRIISEMFKSAEYQEQQEATGMDSIFEIWEDLRRYNERYMPEEPETTIFHSPLTTILVIVAVVILIALMVAAFTKYRARRAGTLVMADVAGETKQRKRTVYQSNRSKVRQIYREFLRGEQNRGVRLTRQHTTEDILRRVSEGTNTESAAALRNVYLHARYDEARDVDRSQVHAAKNAMKHMRKY